MYHNSLRPTRVEQTRLQQQEVVVSDSETLCCPCAYEASISVAKYCFDVGCHLKCYLIDVIFMSGLIILYLGVLLTT